jgi:hypothetical protein
MSSNHIFPLLYAAPISYYAQYIQNPGCIEKTENFTKQSFRTRCRVYGANGVINLSIPVLSNHTKTVITDVAISNIDAWQRNHWKTLESAYKSSPFFEFYVHLIQPLFLTPYHNLWAFNMAFHTTILHCLDLDISPSFTHEFSPIQPNDLRLVYSSKKAHPISDDFPIYQQVFSYQGEFETDLSVLDGLFNLGPELENYLRKLPL